MSQKYDVVCTNPPYMGRGMNSRLKYYISEHFKEVSTDLFSVFIERNFYYAKKNAHLGLMTPFVWMFISSYEKLRKKIILEKSITSLIQLEYSGFAEATVPVCTFTLRNTFIGATGQFINLTDFRGVDNQPIKTLEAITNPNVNYRYTTHVSNFLKIPGNPIAYWISDRIINIFRTCPRMGDVIETKQGCATANNDKYLRLWHEIEYFKIGFDVPSREIAERSKKIWFPYNKGGSFRKWYGNQEFLIYWKNGGIDLFNDPKAVVRNPSYYFRESVSWSDVTSSKNSFRYYKKGFIFDSTGHSAFPNSRISANKLLAVCNNKFFESIIKIINPTMHFHIGYFNNLPAAFIDDNKTERIVGENTSISKTDWDSFETSWDFEKHPLLTHKKDATTIKKAYKNWSAFTEQQFNQLKQNEEELNRIFIEIYGLQDELTPEVEDRDITISKADRERDIKSFISYAVGCMFGRYSLDEDGLIYAGGDFGDKFMLENGSWEINTKEGWKKSSIAIAKDNVIPIADGDYFEDDILERFVEFVRVSFGDKDLAENLEYIAETLGKKANETSKQAIRRYFLKDFYKDHAKTYKKRPIYWLFDSGKQNGFKALIYMHRYNPLTVARVRTDYFHKLQLKYEAEVRHLDILIGSNISDREKAQAKKRREEVLKKIQECRAYDQVIAHVADRRIDIDLDDGVKVNYAKFQEIEIPQGGGRKPLKADLLAKI